MAEVAWAPVMEQPEKKRRDSMGPVQAEQQPLLPKKDVQVSPCHRLT